MTTKYNMVKQAVKSKILDGSYTAHQKISSESELMKEFGVSRHTVRLAIGDLVTKGWLYREQGSGTFCADRSTLNNNQNPSNQKNIAIITTYISDYIFPSIIRGAEALLSEAGYQVSIFNTNNDHENERNILEKIISQQFDGVIVEPTKSAYSNPNIAYYLNLELLSIPYVMINAYYDELEPINIVIDDEKGGFLQTGHLIKLGHKDIVGFFKTDDIQGTKRMKGFIKAYRHWKIKLDPKNIITYNTEEKHVNIEKKLTALLDKQEGRPTALVCYNDELALKLLDLLREKNLSVPSDISIVGYDDSPLAEISEVKLTTVIHPKIKMGRDAAKTIMEKINNKEKGNIGNEQASKSITYAPELVIRSSTGQLKNENSNL